MSSKTTLPVFLLPLLVAAASGVCDAQPVKTRVARIVAQIRTADYQDDRRGLQRLYEDLNPFTTVREVAAPVRYWRGFAMWRRMVNGYNDAVDPEEMKQDLLRAIGEFEAALEIDPENVEAQVGQAGCEGNLAFLLRNEPEEMKKRVARAVALAGKAQAASPDNPRLLWVLGPNLWNRPASAGGGQAKAMELYHRGLKSVRAQRSPRDPLQPSWGEAELLMNLAWSSLNATTPDLDEAERYARSALRLVPKWHYVRDILLPQILKARTQSAMW